MKSIFYAPIFLLCSLQCMVLSALGQDKDNCTVTLLDSAVAKKLKQLMESDDPLDDSSNALNRLAEKVGQLGEFDTVIEEERLTSKAFRIPGTKKYVIASVYYTDESLSVPAGKDITSSDSVFLAIAVSSRKVPSAMQVPTRSLAEVNITRYLKAMRVSTNTFIDGRKWTTMLECRWNSSVELK